MTQKQLTATIKQWEHADGTPCRFPLEGYPATVMIESVSVSGTGAHRSWKYLYYLKFDSQPRMGGYDRRDSFVRWAVDKLRQYRAVLVATTDKR